MESTPEQTAEGLVIVRVLAAVLDRLIYTNATSSLNDNNNNNNSVTGSDPVIIVTKFHAMKPPGISVQLYLERIHRYASCSNECFILALIYIDRLIQRNNFLLSELNVHRVVVTSVLLAAKFFDDAYYNNAYYAKVGGVLVHEMNGLEVDFLFRINFSLHATPDEFTKYRNELLSHANIGVPSNSIPITAYIDDHNGIAMDSTTSPPPAQVSPEIHFSTTPNVVTSTSMTAIDQQHSIGGMYSSVQEPPSSTKQQYRDNVMIVPPDGEYIPTQNGVNYRHTNYSFPSESSYVGFPLHPQPTFHHQDQQQQHHTRSNSMPPVISQDTLPYVTETTTSSASTTRSPPQQYQQQLPMVHSGMPKSDPIHSVRYNNGAYQYNLHPMHCRPQFPMYGSSSCHTGSMDGGTATTSSSTSSSNLTNTTTVSNSSLSSSSSNHNSNNNNYYSGNLILMDHENRIQQPLHLWDGTPITIVQHHHHGNNNNSSSSGVATTTGANNASTMHNSRTVSSSLLYDSSSVGYTTMNINSHQQQQQSHHAVEVVAMSGVGGMR